MGPRVRGAGVALAAAAVLAGCAIGAERAPQEVADDRVPYGLLDAATTTVTEAVGRVDTVVLYLVDDDRLEPVFRQVPAGSTPAEVLDVLVAGPTEEESADGLTSAVAGAPPIAGVTSVRGTAYVDLAADGSGGSIEEQRLAVAEVVFTLTGRPGIGRVAFTLDGEPVDVPNGSGALTGEPLAREDFAAVAPRRG